MLITDEDGQALAVNAKWMDLAELTRANSLGPGWLSVLDPENRQRLRDDVMTVAAGGPPMTVDYQIGAAPTRRWTRWWLSRHELEGLPLVAIGAADVDEDYARQANLYHLATHDSLTGLLNRSHFLECIDQALRRSRRQARHLAVVYVDLDGFKRVNDRGGHSLGDRVLYAIAHRLRHSVRSADMVARIGGDEFAVLCEGLEAAEQADVVARRIAAALTESVEFDGENWAVAASVGAAVDREPDSAEELVDRADRAMYTVKLSRREQRRADEVLRNAPEGAVASLRPERRTDSDPHPPPGFPERRSERRHWGGPEGPSAANRPPAGPEASSSLPGAAAAARAALEVLEGGGVDLLEVPADPDIRNVPVVEGIDDVEDGEDVEDDRDRHFWGARRSSGTTEASPVTDTQAGARTAAAETTAADQEGLGGGHQGSAAPSPAPISDEDGPSDRLPRNRLATDVLHLRESIDSIRRMLDRLLAAEHEVIDIREDS
ncbi:MAG: GGDEF domain-containing protein [Acidobacteriota bacterium]|nr:GGDEF domain-containing protein [Acidobacteriota bacterium]